MASSPTAVYTGRMDPYIKRIATVVVLGMILSILDMTIVNVALDSLSRDLHTSLASVQWVVSAYLLALAAVIPLAGWAVKKFGAFRVYMYALVLFTVGSALCGLASSTGELIAFRVLQGLGGGLLAPTGMTILVKATGHENLPKVMAAIGVPMVLAPILGPTLGGFLLQSVGWHAIFLVNVPVGIATGIVALRLLPRDRPEPEAAGALDWPGLVLAAAGTVGITYGLSQSASAGSFTSTSVVGPILVGCLCIAGFIVRSRRLANPLLDLKLYSVRVYSAATVVMFCMGAVSFGAMLLLPAVLPGRPGRRRPSHGHPSHPAGHRRSLRHEPLGGGDPPVRRRSDLGHWFDHLGGGDRAVPLHRPVDFLLDDIDDHGGPRRRYRVGCDAGDDRGVLQPHPRSGRRCEPAAQYHPAGRGITGHGDRRGCAAGQPGACLCHLQRASLTRCSGPRLQSDVPLGDRDLDPGIHPRCGVVALGAPIAR